MTKIMFTTELLHRICLTVSLSLFIQLALIGDTHPHGAASALTTARNELNTKLSKLHSNNGSTVASTKPNNESGSKQPQNDTSASGESGKDADTNPHAILPSSRSLHFGQPLRNLPHQRSPSSSYNDNKEKRMSSARVGSTSAYLNSKPLSFTTTIGTGQINRKTVIKNKEYPTAALFSSRKGELPTFSGPTYECIFSSSKNCGNENKSPGKSFNGAIFHKRLSTMGPDSKEDGKDDKENKGSTVDGFSSVPFTIAGKPLKKASSSLAMSFEHYSTPAPAWIKLEPYDPFAVANRRAALSANLGSATAGPSSDSTVPSSSQFANRIGGEELSPESFAKRYGWNNHNHAGAGGVNKYGGARLPTWLEELNYQQGTSPILDEIREDNHRRWVKLDPVSVAGVTISKWVPKGTSPSQLPSTSLWPIRGSSSSGGNSGSKPPSPDWWDRVDTEPSLPPKRHQFQSDNFGWSAETGLNSGWGIRYPQQQQQQTTKRRPGTSDAWNDIIYPDTPTSATASWEADKNTRFPSSSPSSSSSSAWATHPGRRPVASWSAPGSSFSGVRVQSNNNNYPHNTNRRYGTGGSFYRPEVGTASFGRPNSYPDPASTRDDPRWVLVSSTSNIENVDGNRKYYGVNRGPTNANERYASVDSDFPYEFYNGGNRHSKMLLRNGDLETAESSYSFTPLSQDELFRRTNATLHSLQPTLKHHKPTSSADASPIKSSTTNPNRSSIQIGLEDLDNMNLQPSQDIMDDVNDDDLLTSLEFEDVGDGRGSVSSASTGTKATANLIVLPQIKDPKSKPNAALDTATKPTAAPKRGFLEGLNPIYTAVGAGMVPATLAAILPMALGRRRRKRSESAQLPDPVLLSMNQRTQKFPNSLPTYLTLANQPRFRRM